MLLRRPTFSLTDKFSKAFSVNIGIFVVTNLIWEKGHISTDLCQNKVMMVCLKKRFRISAFTISGFFTKY